MVDYPEWIYEQTPWDFKWVARELSFAVAPDCHEDLVIEIEPLACTAQLTNLRFQSTAAGRRIVACDDPVAITVDCNDGGPPVAVFAGCLFFALLLDEMRLHLGPEHADQYREWCEQLFVDDARAP